MKYWGYLVAKLVAALAFLYGLRLAILGILPRPQPFAIHMARRERYYIPYEPFGTDLGYTFVMLFFTLCAAGVLWAVVWDQRYRCRTCVRRLRMPVLNGSWTHILLGRPQTAYICPFGHGTLTVEELQITGHQEPDWQPHEDIWTELYSLDAKK
jgi:hypothetical protein